MADALDELTSYIENTLLRWQNRDKTIDPLSTDLACPLDLVERLNRLSGQIRRECFELLDSEQQEKADAILGRCTAACGQYANASAALRLLRAPTPSGEKAGLVPLDPGSQDSIWAQFNEAQRQVCTALRSLETLGGILESARQSAKTKRGPTPRARQWLFGPHEILAKLGRRAEDWKMIKRLNDLYGGPIRNHGSGTKTTVCADELLDWWNNKMIEHQAIEEGLQKLEELQKEGLDSAEPQHNYSRDGTVAPEIQGLVKKRRGGEQT
jgi:hypothetical protein